MLIFSFTAPKISKPTYETLEEYGMKKFKKIEKHLEKTDERDYELHISVKTVNDTFELKAEVKGVTNAIVHAKDRDLRRAIEDASGALIRSVKKDHKKRIDLRRLRSKVPNIASQNVV